ncbi:hypothetical protein BH18ACT9_BH18ACT9_09490 [soil metagenome]
MTEYVILLPGDESSWEHASPAERAAVYDRHQRFAELLAEHNHKVTGGAELTHSREAWVVRDGDPVAITQGPYAETTEQLTGFYTVGTDDLEDLLQVVGMLAAAGGAIEVRAAVDLQGQP